MKKTDPTQPRARDAATRKLLDKAAADGVATCFDRVQDHAKSCAFGANGVCCRICHMGPCRLTAKAPRGVCGADAHTVAGRNFLREAAGGAAAHSDHGRRLALLLRKVGEGRGGDYRIADEKALRQSARDWGLDPADKPVQAVAKELADLFLAEFASQEEPLQTLTLAPAARRGLWRRLGVAPSGVDRMIVEAMHRSTMGVDHDPESLVDHAFRTALADGWGGSMIATACSDILFGAPRPVRGQANLGVLKADTVNVVAHGHEPALSEMLALAARDPEVLARARDAGAAGLTLAGICCTANEVLMRHGIPVAGSLLQQELAIVTGAVELMVTDVQCVMPSLPEVAAAYHTKVVATSDIARTVGAAHAPFDPSRALACAKDLLFEAIANFARRDPKKIAIPKESNPLVAGFSVEAIKYMLGGSFRGSFRPLNDAVMAGRIRGVAGIVGCNNPRGCMDEYTMTLTRELLANDVLVLKTGCAAVASAKEGLLLPEAALAAAGPGLREVCEAVGMPPVLHLGSCVDNSRILRAAAEMAAEGGLGDDLSKLPAVGCAPEWMSEKAVAIGCYFVASGVDVVLGRPFRVAGSDRVTDLLFKESAERFGACFHHAPDGKAAAAKVLEIINARRKRLGIDRAAERKLFDMKDRRAIHV
ncbi:MAG: anaerobic carbon-monoxide dehydrogenase catalytic subunit [Thermodesulfobacteriota bacterium]